MRLKKIYARFRRPSNKKDRTVTCSSLPKHDSSAKNNVAPSSAAKRKVLSAWDINRSGSKRSGCPRPVASSSMKRPANVNTMKLPIEEPKVSKIPVPKPDSYLLSRTTKNVTVGANDLKRNQIAHPEVKSNRSGQNTVKVAPTGKYLTSKSSVRQATRNVERGMFKEATLEIKAHAPLKEITLVRTPGAKSTSKHQNVIQVHCRQNIEAVGHIWKSKRRWGSWCCMKLMCMRWTSILSPMEEI